MCAIAGIVMRNGQPADGTAAGRMADAMRHRGPDGGGVWSDGPVAFGHRRLKVIDLTDRAAQPMVAANGRFVIVFNGEIYNFREIRDRLAAEGYQFRSESGTEVLLTLYERVGGRRLLDEINGIFAFAIWDRVEQTLFAARDHFGVKPFYYAADGDRFLFASEVKGLLAGGWKADIQADRVPEHLAFGYVAGDATLFRGVRRLAPGHFLELSPTTGPAIVRYFSVADVAPLAARSFEEAARLVRHRLDAAVERQLIADVSLGSSCSGGLDSSALTALAARSRSGIDTYVARVRVGDCDESQHSRVVSTHCGTRHHESACDDEDVSRLLATLTWIHDEPLKYRFSTPSFFVARDARRDVTVLFSGEGSDELFGGYWYYKRAELVDWLRRFCPRPIIRAAGSFVPHTMVSALASSTEELLVRLRGTVEPREVTHLVPDLVPEWSERLQMAGDARRAAGDDLVQAALFYDQMSILPSLLACQDRMSMAASIETRVPFLDVDLVRLVNSLPSEYKLRGGTPKAVLRAAVRDILPESIVMRPKHAFDVPLGQWVRRRVKELMRGLTHGALVASGILQGVAAAELISLAARSRQRPHLDLLWNLLTLETWCSVFITRTQRPLEAELAGIGGAGAVQSVPV